MSVQAALSMVPVFALVVFRLGGMMLFAPLFGSTRIPQRVRALLAVAMALGMVANVAPPPRWPVSGWEWALGIGGEIFFGLAMGMVLSFVFIAGQWAGEMIGTQMGLNMSEVFDPQFGQHGSIIGDMYYMLLLVVFLTINGHHAMLRGVHESFTALPLLSLGINQQLVDLMAGLLQSCTLLAFQLAAPVLITLLVVDLALGFISKTLPQMNVMTMGMTLRSLVGLAVLIVGLAMSVGVLRQAMLESMRVAWAHWTQPTWR